jgi:hypothetical protein
MENMDLLYQIYTDYVYDEWELGSINELYEDGFTEIEHQTENSVRYRLLTKEEFIDRKIYERNNNYNG